MKNALLVPLTFSLIACGGSGSSEDDTNIDPNKGNPGGGVAFKDCSADQSGFTHIPLPEYHGNQAAYDEPAEDPGSPAGFAPESFVQMAQLGLMLGMAASNEGAMHAGPTWHIVDEDLNTQIQYAVIDTTETWTIVKNGMDSDGTVYSDHTDMMIEQTASCGLNILQYEDNGALEGRYESTAYEWTWKSYDEGELGGLIETTINQDGSGETVSEDFSDTKSDYPVTILTWDSTGEITVLKTCKTKAGTNCSIAVAS